MDKGHKAIACGTTRNRHLQLLDGDFKMRLITYNTKGKAEAGFRVSQFYLGDAAEYMEKTYGEEVTIKRYKSGTWNSPDRELEDYTYTHVNQDKRHDEIYEAVEATLTLDI